MHDQDATRHSAGPSGAQRARDSHSPSTKRVSPRPARADTRRANGRFPEGSVRWVHAGWQIQQTSAVGGAGRLYLSIRPLGTKCSFELLKNQGLSDSRQKKKNSETQLTHCIVLSGCDIQKPIWNLLGLIPDFSGLVPLVTLARRYENQETLVHPAKIYTWLMMNRVLL